MRKNLAKDPSFRSGTTAAYLPVGGATLSITNDYAFYGHQALLVTKSGSNGSGVTLAEAVPVQGGLPYAFSVYSRLPVTIPLAEPAHIVMQVSWLNSLGVTIQIETSALLEMDFDDTWYRVGGVWTAPAGATFAVVTIIQPIAGSPTETFVVDALLIEQANYIGGYFDNITQAEKNTIVNKALSEVPQVVNGIRLGADIVINDLVLNTIDEDDTVWVATELEGWWGQTNPDMPDIPRGTEDGSYDVEGRRTARTIVLSGFFIPKDANASLTNAINRLVTSIDLVRKGGWLLAHEYPTKASFVRLAAKPDVRTINARGRTNFQVTLRAGDPIKYHWNDADPDGYTNLTFEAADVIGYAENIGTATVTGHFTLTGPAGAGTRVFNASTDETMTLQEPLRGAGVVATATQVESTGGIATVRTSAAHGLHVGDEVSLLNMVIPFSQSGATRIVTHVSDVFPYSFSFAIATDDVSPMTTAGQVVLLKNDVLEVDTYNRAVTYNGEASGHRSKLATLTDWIHFAPGENIIEFYDNITEVEVVTKQLSSNLVSLKTAEAHYLIPGEQINVQLPTAVPLSKKQLTSNVVTLTTAEAHGFSAGDVVDVASTESSNIITKSRTSNVATLTTELPHGINVSDSITVALPATATPQQKQLTANVATLTTQHPHGLSAGDSVTVALPTAATVAQKSLTGNQATLTTTTPHNFAVGDQITVTMPTGAAVVGKARSGSQVVITTNAAHGYSVGDSVIMALPVFANPTGTITANGTTYLVTVNTSAPHNFSVGDQIAFTGLALARWNNTTRVIESIPNSTAFTFRDYLATGSSTSTTTGSLVTNFTNQQYNGTKTLVSASGTQFAYNL